MLPRPRTVPELLVTKKDVVSSTELGLGQGKPTLTKLLLNVTIQRSLGAVQVLMSPDATVDDLITASLWQYAKEGRQPIISSADSSGFDLHYSRFSLEINCQAVLEHSKMIVTPSISINDGKLVVHGKTMFTGLPDNWCYCFTKQEPACLPCWCLRMVKTVHIDENQGIMEDLEAIMGAISSGDLSPLEPLGLYIKDDYIKDDEDASLQGEEGEILS